MKRLLISLSAALLVLPACAGIGGNPKDDLAGAIEGLGGPRTLTLSLQSDLDSLIATDDGRMLTADQAQKILDSSISISAVPSDDPLDATFALSATIAGVPNAVELRFVERALFIHAAVGELVEEFGGNRAEVETARTEAARVGMDWVGNVIDGEWLKITGLEQYGSEPAGGEQPDVLTTLADSIREDAEVEEVGSDDAGTHFLASIPIGKLYSRFASHFREAVGKLGIPPMFPPESELPNKDIKIDFWADGDTLTRIEFDVIKNQHLGDEEIPAGVERFAIRMEIAGFDGQVATPSDVVEIDLKQLSQAFMGVAMGGSSSSTGGAVPTGEFPCELLAEEPPEIQRQYAGQCPEYEGV